MTRKKKADTSFLACYGDGCNQRGTCKRYEKRGKGCAPTLNTGKEKFCFYFIRTD